jgi:hypothetical protein
MSVMRMIKMFGWESGMRQRIAEKRDVELSWIRRSKLVELAIRNIKSVMVLPGFERRALTDLVQHSDSDSDNGRELFSLRESRVIDTSACLDIPFFVQTLVMKQQLTASVVFSSMTGERHRSSWPASTYCANFKSIRRHEEPT